MLFFSYKLFQSCYESEIVYNSYMFKANQKENFMSSKIKSTKKNVVVERSIAESILLLFPILLIVIVLPLIVKMKTYDPNLAAYDWFADQHAAYDFFLYYKQWFFVGVCGLIVLIIAIRAFIDKKTLKFNKTFIPLFLYALLALLSTLFSKYRSFGFSGSFEQFENVFCLIGYVLVAYYTYLVIQSEAELKLVINAVAIGALCIGIIGTFQAFGMDFFNSQFGRELITERGIDPSSLNMTFEEGRVYATLYNPNYVGVYTTIMIPLFTIMLFFSKHISEYVLYSLVVITSAISMFGSQSKAGIICIGVAFIVALFFLRKVLLKKKALALAVVAILGLGFFMINFLNNNAYINAIINAFDSISTPPNLTGITTTDDYISIEYSNNTLYAKISEDGDLILYDENDSVVGYNTVASEADGSVMQINDERFYQIVPIVYYNNIDDVSFYIDGYYFTFSTKIKEGTYLYYNRYGKYSPIITVDSGLFKGHERFASNRGFIWGRTIPLLKDNIILGSGADSFIHAFPQYDYVNYINYGYPAEIISKPHNLFLQVGVQTGVFSLICMLVFLVIYILQSCKVYYNNNFSSTSAQIGLSIFIAVIGFLISAISNDSSISVSPVFWVLLGTGFVANLLTKQQ